MSPAFPCFAPCGRPSCAALGCVRVYDDPDSTRLEESLHAWWEIDALIKAAGGEHYWTRLTDNMFGGRLDTHTVR